MLDVGAGTQNGIYVLGSGQGNTIAQNVVHRNTVGIFTWTDPGFVEFSAYTPTPPVLSGNHLHRNTIDLLQF